MKIRAAVTYDTGAPYKIEDVELDAPKFGEILVRITASGICHTDEAVQNQFIPTPLPAVLGHEGAGIVEAVGPGVTEFKIGDHVGISFGFCNSCCNCRKARPFVCKKLNAINFGGIQPAYIGWKEAFYLLWAVLLCKLCRCQSESRSQGTL